MPAVFDFVYEDVILDPAPIAQAGGVGGVDPWFALWRIQPLAVVPMGDGGG